ncbi:MAG TPA: ankyrin repeat domain-containing protein, partial [Bacteroidales bacterium]|nr:ankyrin repeat domain-containing protein [Bacteroidales bacterium]
MKNLFICCILLLVTQILFAQNSKLNEDLLNACEIGNVEMVNKLLVSGADPNCKSEDGYYPLHLACKSVNSYEISKLLIKHGANVNQRSKGSRNSGLTPIYYAAWNADGLATLKLLIENNADYSKPIPPQYMFKGSNLLGFAASNLNGLEIARYLISLEVNVNEKNRYSTPLSVAIVNNNSIEMIKLLLENGAN